MDGIPLLWMWLLGIFSVIPSNFSNLRLVKQHISDILPAII